MAVKNIYVLGESHTRSFCFRKNVFPIFLSSGKSTNFQSPNKLLKKIERVLDANVIKKTDVFCLYLGEPDSRYQLGYDWYPHYESIKTKKLRIVESKVNIEYLDNTIEQYLNMLRKIHQKFGVTIHVISATGSYPSALEALLYLNTKMKEATKSMVYIKYVDVLSETISNGKIDAKFIPKNGLLDDPIHLNSKVSDILINKLYEMGSIARKENFVMVKGHYNSLDVKNKFKLDPRFGSFTLK